MNARVSAIQIGRDREMGTLRNLLDRTTAGRLTLAVVEGPPGSGKTRLLREFVALARRRGPAAPRVLTCEHPQSIPARAWPQLEVIAQAVPLLVVVTRRRAAPWPEPDAVAETCHVRLGPLSGPAVSALLATLVGGVPDRDLRALAEVAGGNPRAIEDLVAGLREERLLSVRAGRASVDVVRLPARTRERLDATLAALSPPTRHLLEVASTLGARFDVRELAGLLHRNAAALVPAVHEAIASGLVVGADDALRFRHELVRATAENALPRAVRAALHDEVALHHEVAVHDERPGPWTELSDRERQIAHLVGRALTNQQIAHRVGLSPHTVNYHLRQIFRKLNLTSRVELARLAQGPSSAHS